jgi:hypothetical protein
MAWMIDVIRAHLAGDKKERRVQVSKAIKTLCGRTRTWLRDHRQDRASNQVPLLIEGYWNNGLNVQYVLGPVEMAPYLKPVLF